MAKEKRCHYEVLGLSQDSTFEQIYSNYKIFALQNHTIPRFREITQAYKVLSDPKERACYDYQRSQILFTDPDSVTSIPNPNYDKQKSIEKADFEKIRSDSPQINKWTKGELLGQGFYGLVHEGFSVGGHLFAVKEILFLYDDEELITRIQIVVDLLKTLSHPNIVQYYGTEKGKFKIYIFQELVYKPIDKLYEKYKLEDSHVSTYTLQLLTGLKYLHDNNVIHRDIRCSNILVDANGSVKIADFGLAEVIRGFPEVILPSYMASTWWIAPEVICGTGFGVKADIWSVGCTVLEMLTRQHPYPDLDPGQALINIGNGVLPHIPPSLSIDARDFIKRCLQLDAIARPSIAELLSHPFLKV